RCLRRRRMPSAALAKSHRCYSLANCSRALRSTRREVRESRLLSPLLGGLLPPPLGPLALLLRVDPLGLLQRRRGAAVGSGQPPGAGWLLLGGVLPDTAIEEVGHPRVQLRRLRDRIGTRRVQGLT